ncbi:DNA translocase FtsK [Mycobacterium yunnanensis]|uniref:DNA translocase FtsK n=1 Tax=Mycobacterium yunnanensis TaxID=368477 RepID=A0A9X2ZA37_9MYCO|nr:DNA translocase FtsK [Mycobacterium yunnanensis]MCV7424380.1 DNA translocase FtsK [Mycobacterium yunnanensis]
MTITIATSRLIETLTDALQTADDIVGGVHIATQRGPFGDEPGDRDLMTATSTNRFVIGHTWIPVDGNVVPSVWPVESTKTVLAICKSLAQKGKDHTVDIDMVTAPPPEDAEPGDHPGWTVTLSETPALFESDTEFQFRAHHEGKFPVAMARKVMSGLSTAEDVVDSPLTQWGPSVLAPLVAVAKRRKSPMMFFRSDLSWVQVVQIGDTWLGAAFPIRPMPGESSAQPSIEPVLNDATDRLRDTLADMKADGVTVTVDDPKGPLGQAVSAVAEALRDGSGVMMGRVDPELSDDESAEEPAGGRDELLRQAVELVVSTGFASPSMLQRKLAIGYARANTLLDDLHTAGIVGPAEGSKARTVGYRTNQVSQALTALRAAGGAQ